MLLESAQGYPIKYEKRPCPECGGQREIECPDCGGDGRASDFEGDTEKCFICKGDGMVECLECNGTGEVEVMR